MSPDATPQLAPVPVPANAGPPRGAPVGGGWPRRRIAATTLGIVGGLASLASLLLLSSSAQDVRLFDKLQPWLLAINLAGVGVLIVLIGRKLYELARDLRGQVPGSRMKARAVTMWSALALAPILVVYLFSVNAINRGIDSWFDVNVGRGFDDALALSRAALSLRMREFSSRTGKLAEELRGARDMELISQLDRFRRFGGATELLIVGDHGHIVAASTDFARASMPTVPPEDVLLEARQGRSYVSLDPGPGGGYKVVTATSLASDAGAGQRVLVASYEVPEQLGALANGVQEAYSQYGQRTYQRPYLKSTFTLTLTIVLLLSALGAVYGAFFWATRLVKPVQDLIAGTRAVGMGDLNTRLALPSHDEMGFLVHSFNDMTKRLGRARADAERSRAAVEQERASLAVILARLSTGVVSLEADLRLRTANPAASDILGLDLEPLVGEPLAAGGGAGLLGQFLEGCRKHLDAGQTEWREQLTLKSDTGRRELMVACTALPAERDAPAGVVIVFDDISTLLRAQRDAAWGEVARRLAHEIKNPLTPIQLSAERMRRRFLGQMNEKDAEVLERATHTIVQQVEAMKQMVNAFSEYARAPAMELVSFDLNQLVTEVAELYRALALHGASGTPVRIELRLDPGPELVEADRGRVRQILNNLLTNALEALEGQRDPEVSIETRRTIVGGHPVLELTVSDNGPGFQQEIIGQVFDPYVTSKPKGTGLGLAIVKKIVEEHGGRIEADNVPGGGARMRILLPLDDAARETLATAVTRDARRPEPRRERA